MCALIGEIEPSAVRLHSHAPSVCDPQDGHGERLHVAAAPQDPVQGRVARSFHRQERGRPAVGEIPGPEPATGTGHTTYKHGGHQTPVLFSQRGMPRSTLDFGGSSKRGFCLVENMVDGCY